MNSLTLIGTHRAVSSLLETRPKAWNVVRFKGLFDRLDQRNSDLSYEMLSLRSTGEVVARAETGGRQEPDESSLPKYLVAEIDDLVVNPMWLIGGGIGVSRRAGAVSPDYRVFRSRGALLPRFIHYLLRSQPYLDQYRLYTRAQTTFDRRVQQQDLDNLPLPVPPLEEQRAIADYLDCATARIDTLIEEQQRLIEMLRERRRSLVDRVIGGLDDGACRPTNDPWWPELPEGWSLLTLRRVIHALADGPHFSPNYVDDGVMFLSARNVKVDGWSLGDAKFVSEDDYLEFSKRVVPERGDVLYTKGGTTGIARAVDLDLPFQVWVHVAVLKVRHDIVDPFFLAYALNSTPCYNQSQLYTRGATNNDLGLTRMVNIVLPIPPLQEQRHIAAHLDEQTRKIDALIEETERFIELARERRSALITAAVTGQIDVREMA